MVTVALIAILILVVIVFLRRQLKRPKNYPPGPQWLPFVGNLNRLRQLSQKLGAQHLALDALAKEYQTPILGLKLGGELVTIVYSYDLIHKVLTEECFEGRPDTFFIRLRSMGTRNGVTCTDGEFWREQRSFVVRHLRQLGYGKFVMEEKIIAEVKELKVLIKNTPSGEGISLGQSLAPGVLNVLWALTGGTRFSRDDARLKHLLKSLAARGKAFDMAGGTLNQLPWLRYIAPERTGYNLLRQINLDLRQLLLASIIEHEETYSPDVTRDLIDAFLHEMKAGEGKDTTFTESQLIMVCLDLFIAGSQTTSNTLDFAFLMMLLHPEIQTLVQQELDTVIGKNRLPSLEDQGSLPYTEAVLMEVQRLYQVTPIAGPRRVLKNTTLNGYDIPQNSTVLISLWSIHMNEVHWGDPQNFRPSRFLNAAGQLTTDDWHLPFGLGRRRCLGEVLAKSCIFLFFTGLCQMFHVLPVKGIELPSDIPTAGMTLAPKPYKAVLVQRFPDVQMA